jgi:hypothetical protein
VVLFLILKEHFENSINEIKTNEILKANKAFCHSVPNRIFANANKTTGMV